MQNNHNGGNFFSRWPAVTASFYLKTNNSIKHDAVVQIVRFWSLNICYRTQGFRIEIVIIVFLVVKHMFGFLLHSKRFIC